MEDLAHGSWRLRLGNIWDLGSFCQDKLRPGIGYERTEPREDWGQQGALSRGKVGPGKGKAR